MPSPIDSLLCHLDDTRAALHAAFAAIPSTHHAVRPGPDQWSATEVLEHLALVERRMTVLVARGISAARASNAPAPADMIPLDAASLLDRTRPVAAGDSVIPTGTINAAEAWEQLQATRVAFREVVGTGQDLDLNTPYASHPVLGPLSVFQWIEFVGHHEARHAEQLKDIAASCATAA